MEMQDKEFDQLFKAKLDGFDAAPSENVWRNISNELDGKKTKRSVLPYLSIAASAFFAISVSFWLLNRNDKVNEDKIKIVKRTNPVETLPGNETVKIEEPVKALDDRNEVKHAMDALVNTKRKRKEKQVDLAHSATHLNKEINMLTNSITKKADEPVLLIASVAKAPAIGTETSGDGPLPTIQMLTVDATPVVSEKQSANEASVPVQEKPIEKKKARGLGGLINSIVAAVDKREDKLIEFTEADNDEGSRLTAVNLGLFKIKKQ